MLFKIIVCFLFAFGTEWVHCKPWTTQDGYSYESHNYPRYRDNYDPEPTTTTTVKPLYPTLYPKHQPFAPVPSSIPSRQNDFQRPGNPYDVIPLQPNVIGYQNNNHSMHNPNNNFNRPYYDNTRATYPPGTTRRPTFPTHQIYSTPHPGLRAPNGTFHHSLNSTNPPFNNNNNLHGYDANRNDNYNPIGTPNNNGNYGQRPDNTRGTTTYRPFPSTNQLNQQGNPYQNQPNNGFTQSTTTRPNNANQYPNQFNNANQYPNQFNNGNQYQNQFNNGNPHPIPPNYNPNSAIQNQGGNSNGVSVNQNNFNPSAPVGSQTNAKQRPDINPSGVVLAPFPDVNLHSNGGHNQYNYDNTQNRPTSTDANNRYNRNGNGEVPLAGYTGAHVPLA